MVSWLGEIPLFSWVLAFFYLLALPCALRAILRSRTPQGATAWVIALVSFPLVMVPLFLVFGRSKFHGYSIKRRQLDQSAREKISGFREIERFHVTRSDDLALVAAATTDDTQPGFTKQNQVELLIDGNETFTAMFDDIESATQYVVVQFYIFRYDDFGKRFAALLMKKAAQGIKVTVIYDELGAKIPASALGAMRLAGVRISMFDPSKGRGNRFQLNFRNHRKIVVVDGTSAFIGGLNIGNEYLGLDPDLGHWRDTHVRLRGPAVLAAQLASAKDWYWAKGELLEANWNVQPSTSDTEVLVLHSGPADDRQTCLLAHIALINSARKRLWIANPYLVPPESLINALILADLRGVDVRILVPSYSDNHLVMLASQVDEERLLRHGLRFFRYTGGFLHQKVMLVDDCAAMVGSANLDFRSMFLNFEISVVTPDAKFVRDVEKMLARDFAQSKEIDLKEFENMGFWKRIITRSAHLLAPVL